MSIFAAKIRLMEHKEVMQEVMRRSGLDRQQTAWLLATMERLMADAAIEQKEVAWPSLGRFSSHKHPEYVAEDATTGQQTLYPPRITYRLHSDAETPLDAAFVSSLAASAKVEKPVAKVFVEALSRTVVECLDGGSEVTVQGLGTFRVVEMQQGAQRRIAYVPDDKMRDSVNEPFAAFEPVAIGPASPRVAEVVAPVVADVVVAEPAVTPVAEPVATLADAEVPAEAVVAAAAEPQPASGASADDLTILEESHHLSLWIWAIVALVFVLLIAAVMWLIGNTDRLPSPAEPQTASVERREPERASQPADVTPDRPTAQPAASSDSVGQPQPVSPQPVAPLPAATAPAPQPAVPQPAAEPVAKPAPRPAEQPRPALPAVQPDSPRPDVAVPAAGLLHDASGKVVTDRLSEGERLTLMALKHFGDKVFWGYIYQVNADKLSNPNNVPVGLDLKLPDPQYWRIDADDADSRRRAAQLNANLLKE